MAATLLNYALTNLADVKESLGIASSDQSYDNLIVRTINQVTKQIEAYCGGRRFLETTYTQEEYDATQIDQFVLKQRPVTATTDFLFEVRDSGLNINSWETIDNKLYFVDNASGVVKTLFRGLGRWNRWRVTYSAGYPTIPEDLAEAAASLAGYYVLNPVGELPVQERMEGSRRERFFPNPSSFVDILQALGLDQIIDSYANNPIMSDR